MVAVYTGTCPPEHQPPRLRVASPPSAMQRIPCLSLHRPLGVPPFVFGDTAHACGRRCGREQRRRLIASCLPERSPHALSPDWQLKSLPNAAARWEGVRTCHLRPALVSTWLVARFYFSSPTSLFALQLSDPLEPSLAACSGWPSLGLLTNHYNLRYRDGSFRGAASMDRGGFLVWPAAGRTGGRVAP